MSRIGGFHIHFVFIATGLALNFLLAVVYRYINAGSPFITWQELPGFYTQGWPIMLQTFLLLYFIYYSIRHFNKKFSDEPNSIQRFIREGLFVMLVGFSLMELFHWIFVTFMVVPEEDMEFLARKLKMIQTIDVTFLVVIYAFLTSIRIFRYLQRKQLEVLQWQREYAQTEFEAVKNQLNPHFLFNSLSALTSLVHADADRAERFIEKLSKSYRYLLEQKDKQRVPLAEELAFLQSFLFLMTERFGNKLQVALPAGNSDKTLAPHTLMIVFDYILAGNGMSLSQPLCIGVALGDDGLTVHYNRQPKPLASEQAALQLQRLQEQYRFLGAEPLQVQEANESATITIPLLPA